MLARWFEICLLKVTTKHNIIDKQEKPKPILVKLV